MMGLDEGTRGAGPESHDWKLKDADGNTVAEGTAEELAAAAQAAGGEDKGNGELPGSNQPTIRERVQYAHRELARIDDERLELNEGRNDLLSGLKENGVDVDALKYARKTLKAKNDNRFDALAHAENIVEYLEYISPQEEMPV